MSLSHDIRIGFIGGGAMAAAIAKGIGRCARTEGHQSKVDLTSSSMLTYIHAF